jgi:hypothetical protein
LLALIIYIKIFTSISLLSIILRTILIKIFIVFILTVGSKYGEELIELLKYLSLEFLLEYFFIDSNGQGPGRYFFYIIYVLIFYGFFKSKNRLEYLLKFVFIFLFWLGLNTGIRIYQFELLFFLNFIYGAVFANSGLELFLYTSNEGSAPNLQSCEEKDITMYLEHISKISEAIKIELKKLDNRGPHNPYDFCKWLIASEMLSEEECKNILKDLGLYFTSFEKTPNRYTIDNQDSRCIDSATSSARQIDFTQFYNNIPKFLKYNENMDNFLILNGNIYLSSVYSSFLKLEETLQVADGRTEGSHRQFENNSNITICNISYYYFLSIDNLLYSNINKNNINFNNEMVTPIDIIKKSEVWEYFKKYYYIWFIELNVPYYVNDYLFFFKPLNQITIQKFMFSKYLSAYEYSLELKFLLKAIQGFSELMEDKHTRTSLIDSTSLRASQLESLSSILPYLNFEDKGFKFGDYYSLNEGRLDNKSCFLKFWVRQLINFNANFESKLYIQGNTKTPEYIINMYDINIVLEELLENILFAQCKILESYWTINTLNNTNFLNWSLSDLDNLDNLIIFYNDLYNKFRLEIILKYEDVYSFRREFHINRFKYMSLEAILNTVDILKKYDSHLPFNSKLNHQNIYKKIFPYGTE